ncbi:TetR family transcriptional regulator [Pseudoduganella sp. FT25W]|jgi:TetR/AcrR family transcriptional repressor of mexJK operon|uniref:TetR family transcriptional regulator n=1 Tax=Duganella alba TaxID=2666081 RepID=A0A6L5QBW1_9BURK|nr:TetR/AcrR family transcriptional regulator [Duganella alba]MRX07205.1 TetR family transcriptional regulator [Duganella alba]MRX15100.1 TetR family transcriptional regulator [Duganella alba]
MNTTAPTDAAALDEQDCPEGHYSPDSPCFGKAAGRPRAADKAARREALLHTAGQLFLEKGYSKVSLEMIAREAHVAVRTIYVKFGGKAGLLNAIIANGRENFMSGMEAMETDPRPMEDILHDFGLRFLRLCSMPTFTNLHRMVVAEATTTPELAETFFKAGPQLTRDELGRFFARPEIKAQLRPGLRAEMLPVFLINCIMGDYMSRLLFPREHAPTNEELRVRAAEGVDLFLHGVRR